MKEWTLEDSEYRDCDALIEEHEDFELYSIGEGGITGFGIYKKQKNEYWSTLEEVDNKTLEEAKAINEALYQEALRFGKQQSIGQLSLF